MNEKVRYSLIIFDLDGTLLDTLPDLAGAVNHALARHGKKQREIGEIRSFISNGVRKLIERALFITEASKDTNDYEVTDRRLFDGVFNDFVAYYLDHVADNTIPYPGIRELVMKLKQAGMQTAVVTNKREDAAEKLMDRFFPGCFDAVYGDGPDRKRKPDPDSVIKVMELFGRTREETVYIGDSDVDHQTASNAGVDDILVTWGYRDIDSLIACGGRIIAERPDELETLLMRVK